MRRIFIMLAVVVSLCSCKTTKYVPVESVRTEYRDVERLRVDTVIENDTRFVYIKGDTVIDRRTVWKERVKEIHDTTVVERRDTVTVPYEVEKKLTRWQRTKQDWGGYGLGLSAALAAVLAFVVLKRK